MNPTDGIPTKPLNRPISPDEVVAFKRLVAIPDIVFNVFNNLIAKNWRNDQATVKQADVVGVLVASGIHRERIFSEHMLDIEDIYAASGWDVVFDKPSYNETYTANWKFTKAKS